MDKRKALTSTLGLATALVAAAPAAAAPSDHALAAAVTIDHDGFVMIGQVPSDRALDQAFGSSARHTMKLASVNAGSCPTTNTNCPCPGPKQGIQPGNA